MKKCPVCGRYMEWYMTYRNGITHSGYRCICGYDNSVTMTITVIDHTEEVTT